MELDVIQTDEACRGVLGQARVGDAATIHYVYSARSDHLKVLTLLDDEGRILIDANPKIFRIEGDSSQ